MELHQLLAIGRRWLWLILLSITIAASASYLASKSAAPLFRTKTTLMVGRIIQDPDPNASDINLGSMLAGTYAQLAQREAILRGVVESLDLPIYWGALASQISTAQVPRTQLLEIYVVDTDPVRAKILADEVARQLILQSPSGPSGSNQEQIAFIQTQLEDLKTKIEDAQEQEAQLREELDAANSALQIQNLQNQIDLLNTKIAGWQETYSNLLVTTQGGEINSLTVVEEAAIPNRPFSPNVRQNVLFAVAIGLILAIVGIVVIEYADDTLKSPNEITKQLDLPVIGYIGETRNSEGGKNGLYVSHYPRSPVAESYRALRSNLRFMDVDKPLKSILVTSANVDAGKTSVAANLAAVIAQGGKKVILLDADLRKPSIHEFLNLENDYGLSGIFQNGLNVSEAITTLDDEKLFVITSGKTPPNPSELLASEGMDLILGRLKEMSDFVIIDSPPSIVTDTIDLSSKVDGVLIVIRPGHTRKKAAKAMMEHIKMADARVLGVVMNRIPQNEIANFDGYYNYPNYYSDENYFQLEDEPNLIGNLKKVFKDFKMGIAMLRGRFINR